MRCGDSFVVRLHFEAKREVADPIFGIEITTSLGLMVAHIHTYNNGFEIPVLPAGPGYIDVRMDDVNLLPGRYLLSLYSVNLGDIWHDVLPHCTALEVQSSTRYGLMRGLIKDPLVIFDCHWEMGERRSQNARSRHRASLRSPPLSAAAGRVSGPDCTQLERKHDFPGVEGLGIAVRCSGLHATEPHQTEESLLAEPVFASLGSKHIQQSRESCDGPPPCSPAHRGSAGPGRRPTWGSRTPGPVAGGTCSTSDPRPPDGPGAGRREYG